MNIPTLQTGAFTAISTQLERDKNDPSPAAKLQIQPTLAQQAQDQKAAQTSFVINKQPLGFVNLHGETTGKVLDVKA